MTDCEQVIKEFGEVKRDIAGFPLIESYVTEEVPPHTLVVTVTERTPVVAVQSGSSFDLVDPAGELADPARRDAHGAAVGLQPPRKNAEEG